MIVACDLSRSNFTLISTELILLICDYYERTFDLLEELYLNGGIQSL